MPKGKILTRLEVNLRIFKFKQGVWLQKYKLALLGTLEIFMPSLATMKIMQIMQYPTPQSSLNFHYFRCSVINPGIVLNSF